MSSEQTIIIIMAGGLGKRMNSDLPKVLHKIKKESMLVHIVKHAKLVLPKKIIVVVGKYRKIIEETLINNIDIDMENIFFVDQPEPLGTGHAIQCCIPMLKSEDLERAVAEGAGERGNSGDVSRRSLNTSVLILSGDIPLLQTSTMLQILANLNKIKITVTEFDDPYGYGRIVEQNKIFDKIVEEKDCNFEQKQIKKVNCGIYAFNSEILCKYLPLLQPNNSQGGVNRSVSGGERLEHGCERSEQKSSECYLTDIVEIIKIHEKINIEMFEFSEEDQIEIIGINTVEQLDSLESRIIAS